MAAKKRKALSSDELVALLRDRAQRWLTLPNVTSIGVGFKSVGGVATPHLSIQVTVSRKLKPQQLRSEGLSILPKFIVAPDGRRVPVDVLERNYGLSFQLVQPPPGTPFVQTNFPDPRVARRNRLAQLTPGISIGSLQGMAGSIGAIVYDNRTGVPCILSNAHVLAGPNPQPQDIVVQPGRSDSAAVQNNAAARLLRVHIGLEGDCAVATVTDRLFDPIILELNTTPRQVARAQIGDKVIKSGRTTGVTRGVVTRIGVVIPHNYGAPIGVRQVGGFEIGPDPLASAPGQPIAAGGDSGATWLIRHNNVATDIVVGLHFAEQTDPFTQASHALACNFHSVLTRMDVSLTPKL